MLAQEYFVHVNPEGFQLGQLCSLGTIGKIYVHFFACQNHRGVTFNDWAERRETKHPVALGTVPNKEEPSLPKCQERPQQEHSNPSFAVGQPCRAQNKTRCNPIPSS